MLNPKFVTATVAILVVAGCSSSSSYNSAPAATSTTPSTTVPRPTPRTLAGSQLKGDVAFLGPIHTVPVGDLTMAYRQFGAGPDLLLIAGQASPMSQWPVSTLHDLANRHRVTIYDNRDLGNTTDTKTQFQLTDLADDAAKLSATLGLDHPAVFGWSTGGEIGLLLATRHPDAISKLAITGATPGGPRSVLPPKEIIELFADPNPDVTKLLDVIFSPTPAGAAGQATFLDGYGKVPQPESAKNATAKYDVAEKAYWAAPEPKLDAISMPVLVMNGQADYAVPPANAKYIAQRIGGNAQLELDAGGRHGWFIEHAAHFNALMNSFLG